MSHLKDGCARKYVCMCVCVCARACVHVYVCECTCLGMRLRACAQKSFECVCEDMSGVHTECEYARVFG